MKMNNVDIIYRNLLRYDERISLIKEDVKQEIYIACLTSDENDVFKAASRLVYRLLCDFGYSRKKGKDNFDKEEILSSYEESFQVENSTEKIETIKELYLQRNYTAKQVCNFFGVNYNPMVSKYLGKIYPKNLGHGGNRRAMICVGTP